MLVTLYMYRNVQSIIRMWILRAEVVLSLVCLFYVMPSVTGTAKPLTCSFESTDSPFCQWQQASQDNFDWTRLSGSTPSSYTGPESDHTTQSSAGYYLYIEVSGRVAGENARLITPFIEPFDNTCTMTFYYNMFGNNIGSLHVYMKPYNDTESEVWNLSGNQGSNWFQATVTFNIKYKFEVIIEGVRGSGIGGDIAIDDISFSDSCENFNTGSLRIVPDSSSLNVNQGRIDIYVDSSWGSICDRNFDIDVDGIVACLQLGYRRASSVVSEYLVFDTNLPKLDNIRCNGNETSLLDCPNDGIGVIDSFCSGHTVVNLKCSDIIDICDDVGPDAFHCDNIHCIPSREKCDFSNNCGDNSDEAASICDAYPGRTNFQTDFGEWSQPGTNVVDWSKINGFSALGPSYDHTGKRDEYFLIVNGAATGVNAQLCLDRPFEANPSNCSVRFYYYRNSDTIGSISLIQRTSSLNVKWTIGDSFESSTQWGFEDVAITSTESFHLCFQATTTDVGYGYLGIDDISLTPGCIIGTGECEVAGPTFTCNNGLCIHQEYLCDHIHHCLDASDENSTLCEQRVGYCNFEETFCDWYQSSADNLDWIRHNDETPSPHTGPSIDHSLGTHLGYYAYIEASGGSQDEYADLLSPMLKFNESCELRLYYHRNGYDIGSLQIGTMTSTSSFSSLITYSESPENEWTLSTVVASNNVNPNTNFQFVVRGNVGSGPLGDISIDDLSLSEGCIPVTVLPTTKLPTEPPRSSDQSITQDNPSMSPRVTVMTTSPRMSTTKHTPIHMPGSSTSQPQLSVSSTILHSPVNPTGLQTKISTDNQKVSPTEGSCDFELKNQQSSSCEGGFQTKCSDNEMTIVVEPGVKTCSWKIQTMKDFIKLKFNGTPVPENDELTVKDENSETTEQINDVKNEWTSETQTIEINVQIKTRLKRDTEINSNGFQLELKSESKMGSGQGSSSQHTFIGVGVGVVIVLVLVLTVIIWRKTRTKRPLPYELPEPDVELRAQQSEYAEVNDAVHKNSIYNMPDSDDIKLLKSDNGVVKLPKNSNIKLQRESSCLSVGNDYEQMARIQSRIYSNKLPAITSEDYLVPALAAPPAYDEICPPQFQQARRPDNPTYHCHKRIQDVKVYEFLKDIDLHKYIDAFEKDFVVFDDIPYMEADELRDMGFDKKEINRFMRRAKRQLKKTKKQMNSDEKFEDVAVPPELLCPISRTVMVQPVMAADDHTYDYDNIKEYLKTHTDSPVTHEELENKILSPNIEIADRIQKFKVKIETEQRRKLRKMRRERSDLAESRPETPMTDVDC